MFLKLIFLTSEILIQYFSNLPKALSTFSFLLTVILISATNKADLKNQEFYSPYQNISVEHNSSLGMPLTIKSSHIWFQTPLDL